MGETRKLNFWTEEILGKDKESTGAWTVPCVVGSVGHLHALLELEGLARPSRVADEFFEVGLGALRDQHTAP